METVDGEQERMLQEMEGDDAVRARIGLAMQRMQAEGSLNAADKEALENIQSSLAKRTFFHISIGTVIGFAAASLLPPRFRAPGRFMGASMGSLLGFQLSFDSGARNTVSQLAELQSPLGNTVRGIIRQYSPDSPMLAGRREDWRAQAPLDAQMSNADDADNENVEAAPSWEEFDVKPKNVRRNQWGDIVED